MPRVRGGPASILARWGWHASLPGTLLRRRVLLSICRAYAMVIDRVIHMAEIVPQTGDLLRRLPKLAAEQRMQCVRAAGAPGAVLAALADEVEKLAINQVSRALEGSEALVAVAEALGGVAERARVRRARAQSLAYAGRFEEALPVYQEAIALALKGGLRIEAARARLASIHALVHLARYREAVAAGEAARAVFAAAGETRLVGRAETSLGGVYQKNDDPAEALRHFDRARPLLADDPVALAQLDSNRGLALLSLDDFAGAESAYRSALAAFEQAQMAWAGAIVEGNLAVLATRQGRLARAVYFFERARRHLERDAAPVELARMLAEQADALVILGVRDLALEQYGAALPVLREHGQVREALQAQAGLGRVLALVGHLEDAETHLAQAARMYAELGQPAEGARLELIQAEIALRRGAPDQATALAGAALGVLRDRPADAAATRYQLAQAALAAGDLAAAKRELDAAIPEAERLGIAPLSADLYHTRGLCQRADGDGAAAVSSLRIAVRHIERIRGALQGERFRASFHGSQLAIYEDLVTAALEQGGDAAVAEAFGAVEAAKSRSLLDLARGGVDTVELRPSPASDRAEAALLAELSRVRAELNVLYSRLADARSAKPSPGPSDRWQRDIGARERRIVELESRLAAARGVAGLYAPPVDLATATGLVGSDTALVEYFVAADELLALVIRDRTVHVFRHLARPEALNDRVQRMHFQLRRALRPGATDGRRGERLHDDARRELAALHATLLAPLRGVLVGAARLLIVPHGALHTVPFHALWDGEHYLIQSYDFAYGPSASLLAQLGKPATPGGTAEGALVVGVADERAPQIEAEVQCVAAALRCERLLAGKVASVERVREHAPHASVIHIACHGQFSAGSPHASGLRLADRWLTLNEIYELPLRARLVTLSGCETGRNVIGCGDELLGLVRGFIAAGAAALLVSLWKVNDESTGSLMSAFYNRITGVREHYRMSAALRAAQLEVMTARPHPALWAPFILIGET